MVDESEENRTIEQQQTSVDPDVQGDILDRFEEAWRRGEQPIIDAYLPANPTLRRAVLGELIHIDLLRRLQAGESVRVDFYLQRFPNLKHDPAALLELIKTEYKHVNPTGSLEEYLERFPTYVNQLKGLCTTQVDLDTTKQERPVGALPKQFGRYLIARQIGGGAMGDVYEAYDTYLQRSVALKVPAFSRADKEIVQRFLGEAKAAAVLHHPHICPVYEAGEIDGIPYFTMACIDGMPLSRRALPAMPPREAVELIQQLALALAHAHEKGVVHRDLKPGNIMIDARKEPIILDFGLALRLAPEDIRATVPGTTMGTPAYMAPEQALGLTDLMGPGCDIFSLGVIFYELLTGQAPFTGRSINEVMTKVVREEPVPPRQLCPDLDPRLEEICLKAMAKSIDQRFASMKEFAAALQRWSGETPSAFVRKAAVSVARVDPRFVEEAMGLIREWGWERSLEILKSRIHSATDEATQAGLHLLIGWLAGERGCDAEALQQFRDSAVWPSLSAWAHVGEAFVAMRQKNFDLARQFLAQARQEADPEDATLQGAVAHLFGSVACHQGKLEEARKELYAALEKFGPDHFTTGRVLDSLGMLQASRNNFHLAFDFYSRALEVKQRHHDDAGVALAHGQLGRLCLDWGHLQQADEHFRHGIEMARRIGDQRGETQLYNHRGQVQLLQNKPAEAGALLDETIRSAQGRWSVIEGYARKDRALAYLAQNDYDQADVQCQQAELLFQQAGFAEGAAHVLHVRGLVRRAQGKYEEALRCFRDATGRFAQWGDHANAAPSCWQLARTLRQRGTATVFIAEELVSALDHAEKSRRGHLITAIEKEMQEATPLEFVKRVLHSGTVESSPRAEEVVTLLALELREHPANQEGPHAYLERCNDLFAEIEEVLAKKDVKIIQYHGEGLLALCQGRDHASRAVNAALEVVQTLEEFNRPRRVLGWSQWNVYQALASGLVCEGKVGTARKFDRTAVGPPVSLVFRLLAEAETSLPCVDEATFEGASPFSFKPGASRTVNLKGIGLLRVWDLAKSSF